jgi:hypothetical protein
MDEYEVGTIARLKIEFRDLNSAYINPTVVSGWVYDPNGNQTILTGITNTAVGRYYGEYLVPSTEGDYTVTFMGDSAALNYRSISSSFFVAVSYSNTDVDHLIPVLRFYLGDYATLRYPTDALRQALIFSIRMLMRRWASRYVVNSSGTVTRTTAIGFDTASPPVIQYKDEPPVVIQAAIIIKSGSLQDSSWQIASWKDDEIAVSNIQADRSRSTGLDRDIDLLETYFKRRLHAGSRQELPGFHYPPNYREG